MTWGLRHVAHEVDTWKRAASAIPDPELRADALQALEYKRANIDGAALFSTLATRRSPALLRLLVAFEILADYLDCASERAADAGIRNGLQLHRALYEALDPRATMSDYYRYHPHKQDGGYARTLVSRCRESVLLLPSYPQVRPLALQAARLAQVLAINHQPDPALRNAALAEWASEHFPNPGGLTWFEWTGAASAWLTILALLALAADPGRSARDAQAIYDAYLPWVSLAGTMLDSYSDVAEDAQAGAHSYIAHYRHRQAAIARVAKLIARAQMEAARLPDAERHIVLSSCMIAMYLSKDSARADEHRAGTRTLAHAGGPLPLALLPILRGWRIAYGQQADGRDQPARATRRSRLPRSAPAPATLQTLAFWRDPHAYLAWCRRRYGSSFTISAIGMAPLVFLSTAEDIKAIVRAPADVLHPGAGAAVIAPLVGEGSFMLAEEDDHLSGRRAILPAFQHSRIADHAQMITETVRAEAARWPRNQPFAIHPHLRALSLKIILQTIFGVSNPRIADLHPRLLSMLSVTASLALQERQLRYLPPWHGIWRRFLHNRNMVYRMLDSMIAEQDDGLAGMLHAVESGEPNQTRQDLMSLILAGHETTASELAWAFQLLAHNPRVALRLASSVEAGEDRYVAATVREVLRHRPVFLFTIPRVVNQPLELGGRFYQPPEQLVGCIHLMHHDPDVYEQPNTFRPERFLADDPAGETWMPWGGGRKRCPGHHLATLEMQIVLQTVLADLEVLPAAKRIETARWRSVIVTPGNGCRIVLRRRLTSAPRQRGANLFLRR